MKRSGAQVVWESLLREGVRTAFGFPGGVVIPLYHYLPDYDIHHVLVRHEQAAVHAADAYARVTGRIGICLATSGPGATNLVTGLATAYRASSPVLAITGQAPTTLLGTDAFQEVDIPSITDAVTKHNYLVTSIQELPQIIRQAFYIARTGQPGPVLIVIPVDVQQSRMGYAASNQICLPGYEPAQQLGDAAVDGLSVPRWPASAQTEAGCRELQVIVQLLFETTLGDIILVCDQIGDMPGLNGHRPRILLTPGALGTKGFALPAAIGVQMALPNEEVWVLAGDDGIQATIQELATIVQEKLPIRIAVLNGGTPPEGNLRKSEAKGAIGPFKLVGPDFVKLAEAYRIQGLRVKRRSEVRSAIARAANTRGPMLIDFLFE